MVRTRGASCRARTRASDRKLNSPLDQVVKEKEADRDKHHEVFEKMQKFLRERHWTMSHLFRSKRIN